MNKEEAASFLGVSVRTLQRYVESGKVGCLHQRGVKGSIAVFDRGELEKFKEEMTSMTSGDVRSVTGVIHAGPLEPGASGMPVLPSGHSAKFAAHYEPVPTVPPEIFDRMTTALEAIAAINTSRPAIGDGSPGEPELEGKKEILPPSELSFKLMLDLDEVSAIAGLSKGWLYEQIREGAFPAINPTGKKFMVKRADLDRFIEKL